jgi:hypothetical protein
LLRPWHLLLEADILLLVDENQVSCHTLNLMLLIVDSGFGTRFLASLSSVKGIPYGGRGFYYAWL